MFICRCLVNSLRALFHVYAGRVCSISVDVVVVVHSASFCFVLFLPLHSPSYDLGPTFRLCIFFARLCVCVYAVHMFVICFHFFTYIKFYAFFTMHVYLYVYLNLMAGKRTNESLSSTTQKKTTRLICIFIFIAA